MRKKEKEIKDKLEIESIIKQALVCRLGLCDHQRPYIVPLNFGYQDNCLYFHSFPQGQKIDFLKRNDRVCFEIDVDCQLIKAEKPCDWGMRYRSVIGFGQAFFVEDEEEKRKAMDIIMGHYSSDPHEYPESVLKAVVVIKVEIESLTGKKLGY